jgi:hypothetical protein
LACPEPSEGAYREEWEIPDDHPLIGTVRKVNRAQAHLEALKEPIERFREERPNRLTKEFKSEGKGRYLYIYYAEPERLPPPEWSVEMGEVLYNLQSALDHLGYQLAARHSSPEEPDRPTFPIFKNKGKFWKKNEAGGPREGSGGWKLARIPEDARDLVLEVQPYQCGDRSPYHPLWLLHELGNEDKHKTLHVVTHVAANHRVEVVEVEGAEVVDSGAFSEPFDSRAKVGWVRLAALDQEKPQGQVKLNVGFAFQEAFAVGPAAGQSAWDVLKGIHNYVTEEVLLRRFLPYFDSP